MNNFYKKKCKPLLRKAMEKLKSSGIKHAYLIGMIGVALSLYQIIITPVPKIIYEIEKKRDGVKEEVYSIKIINNGTINLRDIDFDKNLPWGIKIINGTISNESFIITSASNYLKNSNNLKSIDNNQISFTKFFFDIEDSFSFDLIISKNNKKEISFISTGKISGLKTIEINPFIFKNFIIKFFSFVFTTIYYIILLLLFSIFPLIVKILYKALYLDKKAHNIYSKSLKEFDGFEDIDLFTFLFKFYPSDLKTIQHLIENKEDILDYYKFKTTGKGKNDRYYYDYDEAEHHIKKGGGSKDEIKIYLIDYIYRKFKKYLVFTEEKLSLKNEKYIIKYINKIIEHKQWSGSVNSYTFIMN